ncbi:hypothetical protein BH24BAC1_BH24BAC1_04040 [soil metagenome]
MIYILILANYPLKRKEEGPLTALPPAAQEPKFLLPEQKTCLSIATVSSSILAGVPVSGLLPLRPKPLGG